MQNKGENKLNSRIEWIDIAKGIGIICVVIGHIIVIIPELADLCRMIYLFHMPLFFFLSGILFKKDSNQIAYIIKKVKQLIIPYFSVFLLIAPVILYVEYGNFSDFLFYLRKYIWGGEQLSVILRTAFISMWFLISLFFTQIIYNYLQNSFKSITIHIVALLLYVVNIFQTLYGDNLSLPLSLHTITLSIPIYHLAYLFRKRIDKLNVIIIVLSGIAFLSPILIPDNSIGLYWSNSGIPVFSFISSILVVIGVVYLSKKISGTMIATILQKLGNASLVIMCFHFPIYLCFFYLGCIHLDSSYIYLLVSMWAIIISSICYVIYILFNKFKISRILFLGKNN